MNLDKIVGSGPIVSGVGPIRNWPNRMKVIMLKSHKSQQDRFNLLYWFLCNGIRPKTAEKWTLVYDIVRGRIVEGNYDQAALNQIKSILSNWKHYTYTYWDMLAQKYITPKST